jgi:hypothetical protein
MSEQMTPEDAANHAKDSYGYFKEQIDTRNEARKKIARFEAEIEDGLAKDPKSVELGNPNASGYGSHMSPYLGREFGADINSRVALAKDKEIVAENLDAFRNAALGDAALDGVQIELQQVDDPGQPIEVHTQDH